MLNSAVLGRPAVKSALRTSAATWVFAFFLALPAFAQSPAAHWKTVATPHFRFHYPAQYEAWARRAASMMESVRADVVKEIGYAPETVTDVIVMNPIADPNGETLPLLGHPRIVLYAEPPEPGDALGEFSEWIDLLEVHETAHLVHLLRPSRNAFQQLTERVLPLDPITLSAPRWVLEGYATVVEGRLTGAGRPNSSIRAAILRKWSASGQMPSYEQLSSDRRFLGMSMAYLAGSAYLEWLEARSGPGSLRNLWARMTAREKRSFDGAFEGVFGDSPERLYGKFVAELTQRSQVADVDEGDLWLETRRGSGDPAVSPDGSQLAIVERDERNEAKLAIYSTGANEEEQKLDRKVEAMLKRDPEDVAAVRTKPVPRKAKHTLRLIDGGDISNPRWVGTSLLFTHRQPDADGFLHHDLFVWNPESNETRRITHLADVKDADPLPGGREAIAVRNRFGFSQLVKVDLTSGAITDYTKPGLDRIASHPRVNADGRVAWAEHDASGWHVVVDGERGADGFEPEWGRDGALYSTVAGGGFIDIARDGVRVTRVSGAAAEAAPAPDGSFYFMSLEPEGFVLRHMTAATSATARVNSARDKSPRTHAMAELPASREYGIGSQEPGFLFGGSWTAYDHTTEAGIRLGDVIGRLDTIAIGATGSDRGVALASTWRGWPVDITAHAFHLRNDRGVELRAEHDYVAPLFTTHVVAGSAKHPFAVGDIAFREWRMRQSLRFAADSDRHWRATFGAAIPHLRITAEAGHRLALGGFTSSVVPQSLRIERVDDPALPRDFAFADRYRSARIEVTSSAFAWFWQRYRIDRDIDVRGFEIRLASAPVPLIKIAGLELTAGAAKVTDAHGVKGWFALRWRP